MMKNHEDLEYELKKLTSFQKTLSVGCLPDTEHFSVNLAPISCVVPVGPVVIVTWQ